ncbi:MAG TPA: DNA polymerase Y family protein [Bauldia sp.]|nr:DNA polymerase Y family protein [Bauldia sp.]
MRGTHADPKSAPLVIVAKIRSAMRLVALDEEAVRLGLEPGQPLADARAMIPSLDAVDEDAAADAALLSAIADWAERYTPLVALDDDGLMLDVTGCTHLFGGEEAMVIDLHSRLTAQGFAARAAIAASPGAASAAARFTTCAVVSPEETPAMLAALPLAALRLDAETVSALDRVGLKRIGQVLKAPRAPLAARFGSLLLRRLDQALGIEEEAIDPRRPVAALIAERRFAEPIVLQEDIAATIASLAASLAHGLEARGEGARVYELALFRVDGAVRRISVGSSRPVRTPSLVLDLFREKFAGLAEEIDAGFGFDMIRLSVPVSAEVESAQVDLAGDAMGEADLGRLIDRIGARLGPERVNRIAHGNSHIPERAGIRCQVSGVGESDPASLAETWNLAPCTCLDRPLRLFARPEPVEATAAVPDGPPVHFRWRRALYRVARAEGPERIAPEWWRDGEELTRDYFRVEDLSGHRFWLFREGLYGRETTAPRWYLHGVFG